MTFGFDRIVQTYHTAQRPTTTQISIGFCILVIGLGLGLGLGHCQSDYTITLGRTQGNYLERAVGVVGQ